MKSEHLEQLKNWISQNDSKKYLGYQEFWNLRGILGEVMAHANQASAVFKTASRTPSPEQAPAIYQILGDIEHYNEILSLFPKIRQILSDSESQTKNVIFSIMHSMERMRFNTQQIEKLRQVANNAGSGNEYPEEVNEAGLRNLLGNSLYNTVDSSQKTLKVIREVLQNAVDATDPKQHPKLSERPDYKPEIHIDYESFVTPEPNKKVLIDLIFEDKGIGMNWDVLSKKFFVQFSSGKSDQKNAAGGFGIAKALIQDAPIHGWSVDSEGIHSSRFHKNIHFGSKSGEYSPPSSEIKKTSDGTILSLYGLPHVNEDDIKAICSVYGINGTVKIFFKGEEIKPKFTMDSLGAQPISTNQLPDMVASDESETGNAERVFSKFKEKIQEKIQEVGSVSTNLTKYQLYLKKSEKLSPGNLYVMVNGHYQFHEYTGLSGIDVVCAVQTQARPGTEDYPLDPGREYLRGSIKGIVGSLINTVRDFIESLRKDDLFKDGIEALTVNEDATPMSIEDDSNATINKEEKLLEKLMGVTGESGYRSTVNTQVNDEPDQNRSEVDPKEPNNPEAKQDNKAEIEKNIQDKKVEFSDDQIKKTVSDLAEIAGNKNVFSEKAIYTMVKDALDEKDEIERKRKLNAIAKGLSTPGQVLIQKNFLAKDIVADNSHLFADILILWQKAIKLIADKMSRTGKARVSGTYIPGLIFSDKVLGLFMPRRKESGLNHDSVSINPITLAAVIYPDLFAERVASDSFEKEAFSILEDKAKEKGNEDTPINRVAKFVFHLATHEMCHLFYPDSMLSGSEEFHKNITKVELLCHDVYEDVRRDVKSMMPSLKKNARKLIAIIKYSKIKKEEVKKESFSHWIDKKPKKRILSYVGDNNNQKVDSLSNMSFKEFVYINESK